MCNRTKQFRSLSLFVLCLVPAAALAQRYTVTDLGALSPTGINSWAQVVGNHNGHAYIWSKWSGLRRLGLLPGGSFSQASAINDLGVVAGKADGQGVVKGFDGTVTVNCADLMQAVVWTPGARMEAMGAVGVGSNRDSWMWCDISTYSTGINVRSQVVGVNDWTSNTYQEGFLWTQRDGMTFLAFGPSNYNHRANAINSFDQIVGIDGFLPVAGHAVVWENEGTTETDLGTLGGPDIGDCSEASAINDVGQIVGWSTTSSGDCLDVVSTATVTHAFLTTKSGPMQDLGTLPGDTSSQAYKINYFGQVIGVSGNIMSWIEPPARAMLTGRPFIWTRRTGMRDLNTLIPSNSGWVLNTGTDINVWGQIVGQGTRNGQPHGYLLTPLNPFEVF